MMAVYCRLEAARRAATSAGTASASASASAGETGTGKGTANNGMQDGESGVDNAPGGVATCGKRDQGAAGDAGVVAQASTSRPPEAIPISA